MATFDIPLISFGGLATGLDTNAIIASLVAVEHLPIDLMSKSKSGYESKITAFNTFKTHLKSLQTAAEALKDDSDFNAFTTSVSEEGILTATASKYAKPGTYQVEVFSLATFHQIASQGFADKDATTFGTGMLRITVGSTDPTTTDIFIEEGQDTLEGLAQAINDSDAEVTAMVVDDGTGTDSYHLVISSNSTGAESVITVDDSGLSGGGASLGVFDVNQAGQNAHFSINGLEVYRPGNSVTDVIQGLTLNLTGETSGSPVALTVSRDGETIAGKIEALVEAHNEVIQFINQHKTFTEGSESGGVLMGESLLLRAQSRLQSIVVPNWKSGASAPEIQILAQIGIDMQNDGTLTVDSAELQSAVEEHFEDVKSMFSADALAPGELSGFADEIESLLKEYTKVEGFVDSTKKNFQSLIDSLNKQISKAEDRLDAFELGLIKKFAALETLMAGLQSQQAFLSNQLFPKSSGSS